MQNLLFLTHRIPFPPNKGDKVRSYHLLKHLSQRFRVHLGTFVDCEEDWQHVDAVKALCGETYFARLDPVRARLRSLSGLLRSDPLTLPYYRDARLASWVAQLRRHLPIKHILAFSSSMAQYAMDAADVKRVADLVDVDSDKWRQYAASRPWPQRWLYRREARLLERQERAVAKHFTATVLVCEAEAELFRRIAPESAAKIYGVSNGADTDYFSPERTYENPYPEGARPLVFTGAMDYWPNVDAAEWFAWYVFPEIRAHFPDAVFYVVGTRPGARVLKLTRLPGVKVTGTVADVRPYLAHAAVAVAPLRIARGIQNKVLEAMAMARPVVVSPQAAEGLEACAGQDLFVAACAEEFINRIGMLLGSQETIELGASARRYVLSNHDWAQNLSRIEGLLTGPQRRAALGAASPRTTSSTAALAGEVLK